MIIYVDIDNTICKTNNLNDYSKSVPIYDIISKINNLYDEGNKIVYFTARGTISGIDFEDLTLQQFKEWGVKFHELKFGKPYYDYYIDDKCINIKDFKHGDF